MSNDDKLTNKAAEFGGKAKEKAGDASGDEEMEAEGYRNQSESNLKQAWREGQGRLQVGARACQVDSLYWQPPVSPTASVSFRGPTGAARPALLFDGLLAVKRRRTRCVQVR